MLQATFCSSNDPKPVNAGQEKTEKNEKNETKSEAELALMAPAVPHT